MKRYLLYRCQAQIDTEDTIGRGPVLRRVPSFSLALFQQQAKLSRSKGQHVFGSLKWLVSPGFWIGSIFIFDLIR